VPRQGLRHSPGIASLRRRTEVLGMPKYPRCRLRNQSLRNSETRQHYFDFATCFSRRLIFPPPAFIPHRLIDCLECTGKKGTHRASTFLSAPALANMAKLPGSVPNTIGMMNPGTSGWLATVTGSSRFCLRPCASHKVADRAHWWRPSIARMGFRHSA